MKSLIYLVGILLSVLILELAACSGSAVRIQDKDKAEATQAAPVPAEIAGKTLYTNACATCHGPTGEGVPGLAKDMTSSEFVARKSDAELVEFIKEGRDASDPLNTTSVAMPPKGGNPALSDQDLYHIVAYLRTIHK